MSPGTGTAAEISATSPFRKPLNEVNHLFNASSDDSAYALTAPMMAFTISIPSII